MTTSYKYKHHTHKPFLKQWTACQQNTRTLNQQESTLKNKLLFCLAQPDVTVDWSLGLNLIIILDILTLMLVVVTFANTKWCKKAENDRIPGKWLLIWEYSSRAIKWIPTWQDLDGFQKS